MKTLKSVIKWVVAIVAICAALVILANSNGLSVSRTVATVGDVEITEEEYRYHLEAVKLEMLSEAGDVEEKDFWKSEIDGKKASDVAKDRALEEAIRTQIACDKANEEGITLSEEELASAHSLVNADTAEAKKQLKELTKTIGADKYQLSEIAEKAYLSNAYFQSLIEKEGSPVAVDNKTIEEKAKETYARVKHILILSEPEQTTNEDGTEIDLEDYKKDAKKRAEEVLAKALAGENFEGLIELYGEDPGMTSTPDGYIIDENGVSLDESGQMIPEFTKGSFAIKVGEINATLIESSYGWHIIKRYDLPTEGEDYAAFMQKVQGVLMSEKYNEYIDGLGKDIKVEVKENIIKGIKVK